MKRTLIQLVATRPTTPASPTAAALSEAGPPLHRRLFWRTYLAWLATCSDDEAERLQQALSEHAPHVRPLINALGDALRDPHTAVQLPASLLAQLTASGWMPGTAATTPGRKTVPLAA